MSAKPTEATTTDEQRRIVSETKEQTVRRRAKARIGGAQGKHSSARFLLACPPSAEIDELPELYDVFDDVRGGGDE